MEDSLASLPAGMFQKQFLAVNFFGPFVKPRLTWTQLRSPCTESSIPKGLCLQKSDKPTVFVEPLIQEIVNLLKTLQPDRAESSAVRKLQSVQAELEAAKAKLQEAGLASRAPTTPEAEEVPGEESEETPPAILPTKRKTPPSLCLGASPKKRSRQPTVPSASARPLDQVFKVQQEQAAKGGKNAPQALAEPAQPPTFTAEEMLTPGKASLKDQPPTGSSDATVKKWLQQYPQETQQMVTKLQATISESKPKKDELQTAAIQYGLTLQLVNKMSITSLLKVISLGALQAA